MMGVAILYTRIVRNTVFYLSVFLLIRVYKLFFQGSADERNTR